MGWPDRGDTRLEGPRGADGGGEPSGMAIMLSHQCGMQRGRDDLDSSALLRWRQSKKKLKRDAEKRPAYHRLVCFFLSVFPFYMIFSPALYSHSFFAIMAWKCTSSPDGEAM